MLLLGNLTAPALGRILRLSSADGKLARALPRPQTKADATASSGAASRSAQTNSQTCRNAPHALQDNNCGAAASGGASPLTADKQKNLFSDQKKKKASVMTLLHRGAHTAACVASFRPNKDRFKFRPLRRRHKRKIKKFTFN